MRFDTSRKGTSFLYLTVFSEPRFTHSISTLLQNGVSWGMLIWLLLVKSSYRAWVLIVRESTLADLVIQQCFLIADSTSFGFSSFLLECRIIFFASKTISPAFSIIAAKRASATRESILILLSSKSSVINCVLSIAIILIFILPII